MYCSNQIIKNYFIIFISIVILFTSCGGKEEVLDQDEDGIEDTIDNCPSTPNPDQLDENSDGIGDVCEIDTDLDGIYDYADNCPEIANEDQADFDSDGIGDTCDPTTVAEDREYMIAAMDATYQTIRNLKKGDGMEMIMDEMLSLRAGEFPETLWIDALTENLEANLLEVQGGDEISRLDLVKFGGTYTFNKEDSMWTRKLVSTSMIEFQFPSSQYEPNLNAVLTISNYVDQKITANQDDYYLPITGNVSFSNDGIKMVEIGLVSASYAIVDTNASDSITVTNLEADIYLNPVTVKLVMSKEGMNYEASLALIEGGQESVKITVNAELNQSTFENLTQDDIKSLTFELKMHYMKIVSASDLSSLFKLEDPTDQEIADAMDVDILINNVAIADIGYDSSQEQITLVYKDDSSEDAQSFVEDFVLDVVTMIEEYTGEILD
ncbi:thrombospondin type 3 repeat-containing protein [Reichenbachiella versicolor]|uniref:thrombospondin type 3 repeat-containing protein n=1 Tax=Reichenbachiella versicolor TaxID=1821036 RepID=UPI000D6E5051